MRRGVDGALNPPSNNLNGAQLDWDFARRKPDKYFEYWATRNTSFIPETYYQHPRLCLEIGAGSGAFFTELARLYPERFHLALERCRHRAARLVRKTARAGLPNLAGIRGNAIPALLHGIPAGVVERIYILYPCPFPKTSQRKHRWYAHPVMPHLLRILKPGGLLIWASDQKFYIDEAAFVCAGRWGLETLRHGVISANEWNDLASFPGGRTKFERQFLGLGLDCYELIVKKAHGSRPEPVEPATTGVASELPGRTVV